MAEPFRKASGETRIGDFLNKYIIEVKIILPVVLYGCETWSLTLREKCKLRVFESRNFRPIFEPKRVANGEQRRLHNEENHSFYRSPSTFRVIKYRR